MKKLSTVQIYDIVSYIADQIVKNNPDMDEDVIDGELIEYGVAEVIEQAIDYISEQ